MQKTMFAALAGPEIQKCVMLGKPRCQNLGITVHGRLAIMEEQRQCGDLFHQPPPSPQAIIPTPDGAAAAGSIIK
jgi:hypothetical protein